MTMFEGPQYFIGLFLKQSCSQIYYNYPGMGYTKKWRHLSTKQQHNRDCRTLNPTKPHSDKKNICSNSPVLIKSRLWTVLKKLHYWSHASGTMYHPIQKWQLWDYRKALQSCLHENINRLAETGHNCIYQILYS